MAKTTERPGYGVTNHNPVDVHVGKRIRLRRTLLGFSQENLAGMLGVTFQQLQKYERGSNRVSASRLWDLSQKLDVPVSFFYDDMGDAASQSPASVAGGGVVIGGEPEHDPMSRRETLELVRAYYAMPAAARKAFVALARACPAPAAGD